VITKAIDRLMGRQDLSVEDIGAVLAEVRGPRARYTFHGDELYIRAKVISTKPKANPYAKNEFEAAWTQPVVAPAR